MTKKMLCCGILRQELDHLMQDHNVEVNYIDAALHVDLDKLAGAVTNTLNDMGGENILLVIGTQCHPDLEKMAAGLGGSVIQARNCIEMLLGEKMAQLDAETRTFYLTSGWLENWREIFVEGLKWDGVDARQNFGYYDRIVLLDTGAASIDEEKILEFYDYAQVPVETMPIELDHFRKLLKQTMDR